MPIISTDIQYRLSGGASNTDVNASLGSAAAYNSDGCTLTTKCNTAA